MGLGNHSWKIVSDWASSWKPVKMLMRVRVCSRQLTSPVSVAQDSKVCLHFSALPFLGLTVLWSETNIFQLEKGREELNHPPSLTVSSLLLSASPPHSGSFGWEERIHVSIKSSWTSYFTYKTKIVTFIWSNHFLWMTKRIIRLRFYLVEKKQLNTFPKQWETKIKLFYDHILWIILVQCTSYIKKFKELICVWELFSTWWKNNNLNWKRWVRKTIPS